MIYFGGAKVGFNALAKSSKEPPSPNSPVKFRDCDGAVLHSYTADEVAGMTELPSLPTREGLVCQGWNWTLQQIKDYVAAYGKCEVGATYTTDDGKTRIKITIQDPKYTTIPIVFQQTVANGVKVNWGDGSVDQTYSGTSQRTISHIYAPSAYPATYTITFQVTNGTMSFPSSIMGKSGTQSATNPIAVWNSMIDLVRIGNGVTSLGSQIFMNCYSLASVTIPNSVTSIGTYAFYQCYSLASITIPSSVTSIGDYAFGCCYFLASVTIPISVTTIGGNAFSNCFSLASVTIPNSVTSIRNNTFSKCYSLASVAIPSSVTSIGDYAFSNCNSLDSVAIPSSVTSIGDRIFFCCFSLASVTISNQVTSINNYTFYQCYSLASVTIPNSVTSIGGNAFSFCYSLASITIPNSVTSIDANAFNSNYGIKTYDFRTATTVPQLIDVNAFYKTPTSKEIIVPDELYDTWKAASNWNSTTNNIVNCIVKASESSLGPLN